MQWVLLALGLLLVWRYAWIMDDAFVYARYADNFVLLDFGLVYNAGEYVEGFTSPLWMLWLVLLRAVGLTFWSAWLGTGLLAFAFAWWLLVRVDDALTPGKIRVHLAMAFLAGNYAVASWFTSGLETPLLQIAAVGYALFVVRPRSRVAQVIVGLSPLVRPELVAALVVVVVLATIRQRKPPWIVIAIASTVQLGWLLFRIWYYADLLPNTFYLKHDPDPAQGVRYLVNAFGSYHVEVLLLLAIACLVVAHRAGARELHLRDRIEMLMIALPVLAYVIRIGGDAMHYRYLAFPFCLIVCATGGAFEAALALRKPLHRAVPYVLTTIIAVASLLMQPPQRPRHALVYTGDTHLVDGISDPGRHRRRDDLRQLSAYDPLQGARPTAYSNTIPEGWCARGYYLLDHRIVHSLGLTDAFLARAIAPAERPGHKYALEPQARSLAMIYRGLMPPGRGTMRLAIEHRLAPRWVEPQLESIEIIERKIDNDHDFAENLGLAFTFLEPLDIEQE